MVQQATDMMNEADALERELQYERQQSGLARQSILHAAFAGRLMPQNPTDEPAALLLARLRATPMPARRIGRSTQAEAFA